MESSTIGLGTRDEHRNEHCQIDEINIKLASAEMWPRISKYSCVLAPVTVWSSSSVVGYRSSACQ